jgi:DNA-binding MarR family transcriptional regulator
VYLTEQGQALRGPVEQAWASADRELTARIGEADMSELDRILSRLIRGELAG